MFAALRVSGRSSNFNFNQGLPFEPLRSDGLEKGQQKIKFFIALHRQASSGKTASFLSRVNEQALLGDKEPIVKKTGERREERFLIRSGELNLYQLPVGNWVCVSELPLIRHTI